MIKTVLLEEERLMVKAFLKTFDLVYEDDIDYTIMVMIDDALIATASKANHIIKCIAIKEDYQGHNLLSTLMTAMIKQLAKEGIDHYFVFSKSHQAPLFKALGLNEIVKSNQVALFEGGDTINSRLHKLKADYSISNDEKACVIINANPMTKGHYHLIKEAARLNKEVLVFVVSEDLSFFPFDIRFNIIKHACASLNNVTVLPTLEYLVSIATFPKYFLKEETQIKEEHAMLDVLTFKHYYMPIFNITMRYVGEEPISPMTHMYNQTMKKVLKDALTIIPRITLDHEIISASTVRKYLKEGNLTAIKPFVVDATYDFLTSKRGRELLEKINHYKKRH